jgi:ubiquinone/menaquinone biosynthesis C-methylase UbiE
MKEKDTARFFDHYAGEFSAIYGTGTGAWQRFLNRHFRKTMVWRFQKTLDACQPTQGKSALDVGTGPGHYAIALAKKGISEVLGIDFAPGMIALAKAQAKELKLENICHFEVLDFLQLDETKQFDYVIVMGFMDYMQNPREIIDKACRLAKSKVLFSFPSAGGILAWQRQIRYKFRCPLFLYREKQLNEMFAKFPDWNYQIEFMDRDFFVTLTAK